MGMEILRQNEQKDSVFGELAKAGHDVKWILEDGEYKFFVWNHRITLTYKAAKALGYKQPKEVETKVNTLKKPNNVQIQYIIDKASNKSIGFRLKRQSDERWSQTFVFLDQVAKEPKANKKSE